MTISENKFNMDLPNDLAPFAYIEDRRVLKTKNAGELMLISFGAMNHFGHYAPEFGGVALLHLNPDVIIAVQYIPWDAAARKVELMDRYTYIKNEHNNMSPQDVTDYFYQICNYTLPAQKQRLKEEYFMQIAEQNKARATELRKESHKARDIHYASMAGESIIETRQSMQPRTPEEVRSDLEKLKRYDVEEPEEQVCQKPNLRIVKGGAAEDPRVPCDAKPKTFNGEELIPIDDNEEEEK